jgi:hypothetical protein
VRVRLLEAPVAGAWPASALRIDGLQLGTHESVEIEGRVTRYGSVASFAVDGVEVDASGAVFPQGTAGLGAGTRVEVEGRSIAGVVVAARVKVEADDDSAGDALEIEGEIASVDRAARTIVVRRVTIAYGSATRFENGSEADLHAGAPRRVHVLGLLAADRTRVDATLIHFED